jgi:hypothetical protein
VFFVVRLVTGQDSPSAAPPPVAAQTATSSSTDRSIVFDDFVDSVIRQERHLTDVMRSFKPIIETYIQEEGSQPRFQKGITPNGDDYFLSRLNLTGNSPSIVPFVDEETWNQGGEKYFVQDPLPFSQVAFAQALFPDFGNFDRQNSTFEFVRWEVLGEVRCAAVDVKPRGNSKKRGFLGRIWVEDQDYSIVRFTGTFTSKGFAQRAFHFDSWRLNMQSNLWMPAYVYTAESKPHDLSSHKVWFKAQTRVWGYDLQNAGGGLFLKALQTRAPQLKNLIRPHLGNGLAGGASIRMSALLNSAPQLETRRMDQIAALPLGGRVRLDPWSNRVELLKAKPVALLSAREKMPFEVTPFFPYLTRLQAVAPDKIAVAPSGQ